MRKAPVAAVCCVAAICLPAMAEDNLSKAFGEASRSGKSVVSITPVFSQLVMFSFQPGFKLVFQQTNGGGYVQEAVPEGETVDRWTQMVTLTGRSGLASNPNVNPQSFLGSIAAGFKRACPETFAVKALGDLKFGAYAAFAAVTGCGTAQNGGYAHSEAALIVAIKA